MDFVTIPTTKLRRTDVPPIATLWNEDLMRFALSFNGYKVLGEDLPSFCNAVKNEYERHPKVLETFNVRGLRILLFYEQRRAKWLDQGDVDQYTSAIVALLRQRLPK